MADLKQIKELNEEKRRSARRKEFIMAELLETERTHVKVTGNYSSKGLPLAPRDREDIRQISIGLPLAPRDREDLRQGNRELAKDCHWLLETERTYVKLAKDCHWLLETVRTYGKVTGS